MILKSHFALTGVAQWIGHHSANQKVTGSIPSQSTLPGLWAWSPVEVRARGNQSMFLSFSFSFPSPLSKNK